MYNYIQLKDYAKHMDIMPGDIVFISSDSRIMLYDSLRVGIDANLNDFIDGVIEAVGEQGTVVFPTYNWDFCKGEAFDYCNTPSKTGTLSSIALKRPDFKRTKHPIYSFAVWGKYQDLLCNMDNTDSFGLDSPFGFFKEYDVKNYIIDVSLQHCFTYTHFVEEQSRAVDYRFIKDFTSEYIDENNNKSVSTYSMFVRDLDLDVIATIDPIEDDLISASAEKKYEINSSSIKLINLGKAYNVFYEDIIHNKSRKLCTYKGQ